MDVAPQAGQRELADPTIEPASYAADAATRLHRGVYLTGTARLRPWQLTLSSYAAMRVLLARPDLTLAQLSRRCFVRPQTMSRMARDLETRGWVTRNRRIGDERALSLRLTGAGETALAEMDTEVRRINTSIERALSPAEIKTLDGLLRRCATEVEADLRAEFSEDGY